MSYQIPQQLEYKEKIMFGLTFKQLAYAFLFGPIALLFFRKISNQYVGIVIAFIISFIAIFFMFFNLDLIIKDYWVYLKFRKVKKNDIKLNKFLGVKEIKDDLIITDKNKKISVLKIQPINFTIKPKSEKDAIIYSFQKFLNSIDFPTQILMRTESINLDDYLNSLESRIENSSFSKLFENYKNHLHEIIENNKIMNRVFYLIIPEDKNIDIQTSICIERFIALNLKVKRLKNNELKNLLVDFFLGDYNGDLIHAISPEYIHNNSDYLEINGQYYRTVYASGYPRAVESGFLDKVVSSLGDFDLSMHIKPYPIERMLVDLNRELQKQRADLYSMNIKGVINPSLEIQYKDTRDTLENLQKGQERLFNISLYINCKADSLKELELLTRKVESELNSLMILPRTANLRMLQGFKSISPLGIDELKANRNITTDALSAFFPFTSQFLEVDDTGVWLGLNRNGIPIIKDIFKLSNPNGLVLAQSGGGKSYFCKLLITRYLLNGTKVMVIDPQGEYASIVNYFKGQRILLSRNSKTIINPLDLMGHEYAEKRLSLMDLMKVMLGDLTEPQKAFIDRALTEAYSKKGINENPKTWEYEPPILSDVLVELVRMEKKAIQLEKTTLRSLINRLGMYTDGVFSFLNKHTNINFDNNFVCFDIGSMPKQVKPTIMFLVLDYLYMKMKSDLTRKLLLIDESWSLLARTEDAGYIFEIVKTCRKFNLGLLLINQEVEGLLTSQAGKSVLANSSYTMLMKQKPAVIDNICKTFNLSDSERAHLLTANIGEGLLIMEDDHSLIKVVASPEEHKLITTNADELLKESNGNNKPIEKQYKHPNNPIKKQINVDKEKGFFKLKDLSKDEIEYLLADKYKEFTSKSILSNKKEKYLIKPRHNESPQHFFLIQDIGEYLKKFTDKIQMYETKKPDIVFKINDKEYAIEVETGCLYKLKRKRLFEKVKLLNKEYGKNWFFVVTNRKDFKKYNQLSKTLTKLTLINQLDKILKVR